MKHILFGLTLPLALFTNGVFAAEYSLESVLNPNLKYDDNILLGTTNEVGSFVFTMRPELLFSYKQETTTALFRLGANVERYTSFSLLDAQNPFFDFSSTAKRERSFFQFSAGYMKDNTRNDAEFDTGDFSSTSTMTVKNTSGTYSYQLNEKNQLSSSIRFDERTYSTDANNDNQTFSISTNWGHQINERLNSGFSFQYSNFESIGRLSSNEDDNYNFSATFNYSWSQIWSLGGQVGMRLLESSAQSNNGLVNNSTTGNSYVVNVRRTTELDTMALSLTNALTSSSLGGANEQESISFTYNKSITETVTANFNGVYSKITSPIQLTNTSDNVREFIALTPSISWKYKRNITINVNYSYRQQKESNANTDAASNAVSVLFRYNWDGLRASR